MIRQGINLFTTTGKPFGAPIPLLFAVLLLSSPLLSCFSCLILFFSSVFVFLVSQLFCYYLLVILLLSLCLFSRCFFSTLPSYRSFLSSHPYCQSVPRPSCYLIECYCSLSFLSPWFVFPIFNLFNQFPSSFYLSVSLFHFIFQCFIPPPWIKTLSNHHTHHCFKPNFSSKHPLKIPFTLE